MRVCGLGVVVVTLLFLGGINSDPSSDPAGNPVRRYRKVLVRRTPVAPGPESGSGPTNPNQQRLSRSVAPQRQRISAVDSQDDYDDEAPQETDRYPGLPAGARIVSEQILKLPNWAKGPVRLDIPASGGSSNNLSPIILLPIPVPVRVNSNGQCYPNENKAKEKYPDFTSRGKHPRPEVYNDDYENNEPTSAPRRQPPRPSASGADDAEPTRRPLPSSPPDYDDDFSEPAPIHNQNTVQRPKPSRPATSGDDYDDSAPVRRPQPSRPSAYDDDFIEPAPIPQRPKPSRPAAKGDDYDKPASARRPKPSRPPVDNGYIEPVSPRRPTSSRPRDSPERGSKAPPPPVLGDNVPSSVLIELFRAQQPRNPYLPPILIRERRHTVEEPPRPVPKPLGVPSKLGLSLEEATPFQDGYSYLGPKYIPPSGSDEEAYLPQPPRFDRSLTVRGELTIPRADYTESYIARWDAASGGAHLQLFEDATSVYRMVSAGGRVTRALVKLDRTGEKTKKHCIVMSASKLTPADRASPVLPDTKDFTFRGYVQYGDMKAEMWKMTLRGGDGEMGAAPGEALAFHHELLLRRANDASVPLLYSVAVDSSVLGDNCDGYTHRYHEVREDPIDQQHFQIDLDTECDTSEESTDMARVEPLREFTMPHRHPRYGDMFSQYKSEFTRRYSDRAEDAMRMNLFMQTNRFVSAAGRVGASFTTAVNFLADRLRVEVAQLFGVVIDQNHTPSDSFPYARPQLRLLNRKLPKEFDWRERGAVSPVQFQGTQCASCWAFAVAGAVEGALFRRTRKLVPLSPQTLVDCAQAYGANGCNGTWPSHAYDYVRDRGLSALEQYPYREKVQRCQDKQVPPVTHITSYVDVEPYSVPALKVAIRRHAPTVVIIDAACDSFIRYTAGVFYDDKCNKVKEMLTHAVLAVGWGEENNESHFILKNSWGPWGDEGYIRIHGESNTCGVLTSPSFPRLEADDVDQPATGRDTTSAQDTD